MNTEAIARRAHTIWEMAGRPNGKAVEHWLQAEGELAFQPQDPPGDARAAAPPQSGCNAERSRVRLPAGPSVS